MAPADTAIAATSLPSASAPIDASPVSLGEPISSAPPVLARCSGAATGSDGQTPRAVAAPREHESKMPAASPALESETRATLPTVVPAEISSDQESGAAFGMTRGDRLFAGVVVAVCLVLLVVHWVRLTGWGARPVEIEREARSVSYHLDINTANWVELAQLDAIGEVLARRIVEDRARHGPFESVDDLRRVKGIGPKTLEKLRPWIKAGAVEEAAAQ